MINSSEARKRADKHPRNSLSDDEMKENEKNNFVLDIDKQIEENIDCGLYMAYIFVPKLYYHNETMEYVFNYYEKLGYRINYVTSNKDILRIDW